MIKYRIVAATAKFLKIEGKKMKKLPLTFWFVIVFILGAIFGSLAEYSLSPLVVEIEVREVEIK